MLQISHLQQVLRAFCLHNGYLGYCQGMNFLAATALLFIGPEDAFWFLIALTERYFDRSYFDGNLAGAQADQEILRELLEIKYPSIANHLISLDIDLATITLNWFIALFFDVVPFNTLLRIWDCFLLEGPKILFRFSLIFLGNHQEEILAKSDMIGIMKVVKAALKLCYDIDGLFKLAFEGLGTLPSEKELRLKHHAYLKILNERLAKKQTICNILISEGGSISSIDSDDLMISDIVMSEYETGVGFVVAGNSSCGFVGRISIENGRAEMKDMKIQFDCRVTSFVLVRKDMAFAGLISGYIVALQFEGIQGTILWEVKLPDIILRLIYSVGRLFTALANGTLTVLENIEKSPTCLELFHIPMGATPLSDVIIISNELWIATACKIIVVDTSSLTTLSTFYVACSSAGGGTSFFEKITCLSSSPYGVFLTTAHSTLIQLWRDEVCCLLFDVRFDHKQRKPSLSEVENSGHISSLFFFDEILWVGTSDGYIIMYAIEKPALGGQNYSLKRYPPGRRLSPKTSPGSMGNRTNVCYIPTKREIRDEEDLSKREFPYRKASKVSISIDNDKQNYNVSINESTQFENDESDLIFKNKRQVLVGGNSSTGHQPSAPHIPRHPFNKGISADSAVSVFSSDFSTEITNENKQQILSREKQKSTRKTCSALKSSVTSSSILSMEYDDLFETYPEEDQIQHHLTLSSGVEPHETVSFMYDEINTAHGECTQHTTHSVPILRRKDLCFSDPVVIAVPENTIGKSSTNVPDNSDIKEENIVTMIGLSLVMKLKISERPVRKMTSTKVGKSEVVLTSAGNFGDDETLLLWKKEYTSSLWINQPITCVSTQMGDKLNGRTAGSHCSS